jgi:hypothetical protein
MAIATMRTESNAVALTFDGDPSVGVWRRVPELPRPGPRRLGTRLLRDQPRPSGTRQSEVRSGRILQLPPVDPESRSGKRCIDLKARRYVWEQAYDAKGYIRVLSSYSGHRSLRPV